MQHDVTNTITQTELPQLFWTQRLRHYALVYRVERSQMGGGFGDQHKYPYAWAVLVYIDDVPARVISARGLDREWTSLDRLERWLREQGFRYWWLQNDIEPLGQDAGPEFEYPTVGMK